MAATIIVSAVLTAYTAFVIRHLVKEQKQAKANGMPAACCGCAAYKAGKCKNHSHCTK